MKRTDKEMGNQMNMVHHMDCLDFMRKVPDKYFDLGLTDPPYGINAAAQNLGTRKEHESKRRWKKSHWDKTVPIDAVFKELFRITKSQIIWGGNYFKLPPFLNYILWDKQISGGVPFAHCEMAWTSYSHAPTIFRLRAQDNKEGKLHPTQKPLPLFEYCIREAQDKHTISSVFDPFIGSGTTAIVCESLDIAWCGCEIESDYVGITNKRLERVQRSLF